MGKGRAMGDPPRREGHIRFEGRKGSGPQTLDEYGPLRGRESPTQERGGESNA